MFDSVGRGWELMGQSWSVLRKDKELIIFPILSGICCLVVIASFVLPVLLIPGVMGNFMDDGPNRVNQQGQAVGQDQQLLWQIGRYALLFLFYFVNFFVIVFFNVALVSCAVIRFSGGNPTVGDGMRAAFGRLPQILAWALLAASVGVILKAIEDRVSWLGKLVISLIGTAWAIVTYLVVPVLAVEKVGPFTAVKRSASLLRKTWGEALVGHLSFGLLNFLLMLPGIFLVVIGGVAGAAAGSFVLGIAIAALGVLYLVGLAIVISTLQQIFLAGLYMYAAEGQVPSGFSEEAFRTAFRPKKGRRSEDD
jgi:hypothetical protein